jgi:hypothetical protein
MEYAIFAAVGHRKGQTSILKKWLASQAHRQLVLLRLSHFWSEAAIPMASYSSVAQIASPCKGYDAEAAYRPRNPEANPLYGVVSEHLETFLARQQERDRPVPHFVERELRSFFGMWRVGQRFSARALRCLW